MTQVRETEPLSRSARAPAAGAGMHGGWKWATGFLMAYVTYGAFRIANGAVGFGQSGDRARIVFFHVPAAILSYVAYVVAAVYAIHYLTRHADLETDAKSAIGMELGFLFCLLATITGSIFAGVQWGRFWNWDPRETSILVMLLLYASYLVLRGSMPGRPETRARLSAVYTLVALVPATFLIWIVPQIPALQSLHPTGTLVRPANTSVTYKAVLYPAFLAFSMLFVWLFQLRLRLYRLVARCDSRRGTVV
jgi:heme exporter protein C